MNLKEELELLRGVAHTYFMTAHGIYQKMELNDVAVTSEEAEKLRKILKDIDNVLQDSKAHASEMVSRINAASAGEFHFRERLYVVRRAQEDLEKPLTFEEMGGLKYGSQIDGPWKTSEALEYAVKNRNRRNAVENSERPDVRGWRPGAYTWQIWAYDPKEGFWSRKD